MTNEKFVVAMLIGGGVLLYWGKFRSRTDSNYDDVRMSG